MPAPRRLRIFRVIDGIRVPHILELDSQFTVISEVADTTELNHVTEGRNEVQPRSRSKNANNPARLKANAMARWASQGVEENPLEGTDELRSQYFDDLEAMVRSHTDRGVTCPPCEHGKLIRRYRDMLEKGGHFEQVA